MCCASLSPSSRLPMLLPPIEWAIKCEHVVRPSILSSLASLTSETVCERNGEAIDKATDTLHINGSSSLACRNKHRASKCTAVDRSRTRRRMRKTSPAGASHRTAGPSRVRLGPFPWHQSLETRCCFLKICCDGRGESSFAVHHSPTRSPWTSTVCCASTATGRTPSASATACRRCGAHSRAISSSVGPRWLRRCDRSCFRVDGACFIARSLPGWPGGRAERSSQRGTGQHVSGRMSVIWR